MNILKMLVLFSLSLLCATTYAHQSSTASFTGALDNTGSMEGEWQVRLYDLEQVVGVDTDGNGTLLWGELLARKTDVTQYLRNHLNITRGDALCPIWIEGSWQITEHFNEGYLVLPVRAQCAIKGGVTLSYSAFFDQDSDHKLLLSLKDLGSKEDESTLAVSRVISDNQRSIKISSSNGSFWTTAQEFTVPGAIHIWKGLDHILFLLSLLLTCVLVRENGHWSAKRSKRDIIVSTTWIVTAFTLAHSITLTATALGWINLPSRWVEVGIAISVVIAALNNISPLIKRLGWMTFTFGLLHGMGFAGVLGELGLPADQKVLTVLSFNVGVEFGQMVVVTLVLPLLIIMRNSKWYLRYGLWVASLIIALVAIR